jgi:hypothetical protein
MSDYRPLLDIIVEYCGNPPKKRGHKYGLKAVHADFESSRGFVWPFPGGTAVSPKTPKVGGTCPSFEGDGLCVALDAIGAAQGGHALSTVLLVSYYKTFGADPSQVRVSRSDVLAVVDVLKMARNDLLLGADLYGANLYVANLYGADLRGANLSGADLSGADLRLTDLRRAYLYGANLYGANLYGANLSGADLSGADLRLTDLSGANLRVANLYGTDLGGANTTNAIGLPK